MSAHRKPRTEALTRSPDQLLREGRQRIARARRRAGVSEGSEWLLPLRGLSRPVSMNDRAHYLAHAAVVADVRGQAFLAAIEHQVPECSVVTVELHYAPRDVRRRDPLNLSATLKPAQDGLVDALVVPDDTAEFMPPTHPVIEAPTGRPGALWLLVRSVWSCASCGAHGGRVGPGELCAACAFPNELKEQR